MTADSAGMTADVPAPQDREKRFRPHQQANFLGFYALATVGVYTLAGLGEGKFLPPVVFYVVFLVTLSVCWWSFWAQRGSRVAAVSRRRIRAAWDWMVDYLRQRGTPEASFLDAVGVQADRKRVDESYGRIDSGRVLALAFLLTVEFAWMTVYSGGPFESPFSQVLLGMALLAPTVAHHTRSILATYAVVTGTSLLFHFAVPHEGSPGAPWYVGTTIVVLAFSALVAAISNEAIRSSPSANAAT